MPDFSYLIWPLLRCPSLAGFACPLTQKEQKSGTAIGNVEFPESIKSGVYANYMIVSHTPEEFILDFILAASPSPRLTSRVITSPAHIKRIIAALQGNMQRYETNFGKVKEPKK